MATLFGFVARFARGRIEASSRNRFALNGIQRFAASLFFLHNSRNKNWCQEMATSCLAPNRRRPIGGAQMSRPHNFVLFLWFNLSAKESCLFHLAYQDPHYYIH